MLPALAAALELEPMPGRSRAVPTSLSASRDAAALQLLISPRVALMAGGDVGLVRAGTERFGIRLGFFGFLELEGDRAFDPESDVGFALPSAPGLLWRGSNGFSVAVSLDELGERWLGPRGVLELALSARHESEHFTGSRDGNEGRFATVPNVGDFVMPEAAALVPLGSAELALRLQHKLFVGDGAYGHGPGLDTALRLRTSGRLEPFASFFAERVTGRSFDLEGTRVTAPGTYLVRGLLGVAMPGRGAELQLFTSLSIGHGKGLLAFREERLWGAGVRLVAFP